MGLLMLDKSNSLSFSKYQIPSIQKLIRNLIKNRFPHHLSIAWDSVTKVEKIQTLNKY